MCYGFLGPLASNLQKINDDETDYLRCLRHGLIAFVKGSSTGTGGRVCAQQHPQRPRPGFKQFEAASRGGGAKEPAKGAKRTRPPSSLFARGPGDTHITAAPGRSPTPISSPP